jgi:hypothetical protein
MRWDVKWVLAVAGRYYQVTVPLVRLDFLMQELGDLNRACAFRQTRMTLTLWRLVACQDLRIKSLVGSRVTLLALEAKR